MNGPFELTDAERLKWLTWLADGTDGDGFCGFDRIGWEASSWILHTILEDPSVDDQATHDDLYRQRIAAGLENLDPINQILSDANVVVVGNQTGVFEPVGDSCERVRWDQLASRLGIELASQSVPPCSRWFPYRSWPAHLWPPNEGSLDVVSLAALASALGTWSANGEETRCVGYFTPLRSDDFERPLMYEFRLNELQDLATRHNASPSNWWPFDRAWFVYTDYDLWATKVSGSSEMVNAFGKVDDLETISWP